MERTRNRDSGKEMPLTLSGKGRAVFEAHAKHHAVMDAGLRAYLAQLSPAQVEDFKKALAQIEHYLDGYIRSVTKD